MISMDYMQNLSPGQPTKFGTLQWSFEAMKIVTTMINNEFRASFRVHVD